MPRLLFRFDSPTAIAAFAPIDDRVMGGRSRSCLRDAGGGTAVFEGEVSLADGGGFASVRSRSLPLGDPLARKVCLEVLGDGRRYKLNLRADDQPEGVVCQAAFQPPPGAWTVVQLALAEFVPTWRGRPVEGAAACQPARLCQVGLVIGDRQAGRFALGLRSIALE